MTNVVPLVFDDALGYMVGLNLPRCTDRWANCFVSYRDGRVTAAREIGWNGSQLSKGHSVKRLMHERPDVFAVTCGALDGKSVQSLVDTARGEICQCYSACQHLPAPAKEYAPVWSGGEYSIEAATAMGGSPWLYMRVWAPGKRCYRKHYVSWNGQHIHGSGIRQLKRDHPKALEMLKGMIGDTTPTQLCAFARLADSMEMAA